MSFGKRMTLAVAIVVVLFVLALGAAYRYIRTGGLIARQKPLAVEASVTMWALRTSVPESAKKLRNPLAADNAASENVSAGQELYKQKCETCHGYDGSGKTEAGGGLYPPPLDLRGSEVKNATDGEVFYCRKSNRRSPT
jgi:mono/diheme cytochrome c family protein